MLNKRKSLKIATKKKHLKKIQKLTNLQVKIGQFRGSSTHLDLRPVWEIHTHVRTYFSNVECSSQIQNRMFSISDHGKSAVQSCENF